MWETFHADHNEPLYPDGITVLSDFVRGQVNRMTWGNRTHIYIDVSFRMKLTG